MLHFVLDSFAQDDAPFVSDMGWPSDLEECLGWLSHYSAQETIARREAIICAIEADAKRFWDSGAVHSWLAGADPGVAAISGQVNGPLFEMLIRACDHCDTGCVDLFKHGAPLLGRLPCVGNGPPESRKLHKSLAELHDTAEAGNHKVLKRLKAEHYAEEVHRQTVLDHAAGRMTEPRPVHEVDLKAVRISQRFAVAQGVSEDGSPKIRCVDSCTESGINPCTQPTEQMGWIFFLR